MYEMQTDKTPIITFADRITCSLLWTYSGLSPEEAPISLATRTASDFVYASVGIRMMYTALFNNAYAVYAEISSLPKLEEMMMVDMFHSNTERPSGTHCFV